MNQEFKNVLWVSDRIRIGIITDCKITRATLWNWANGKTPIPHWAKEKINRITKYEIGKEVFPIEQ